MSINPRRRNRGYTFIEIMLGLTIFSVVAGAVGSAYLFGLRSFQAISNYGTLESRNRAAIDLMTRELREAQSISSYNNALNRKLTFIDGNYKTISYTFDRYAGTLTRTSNNVSTVLLRDCNLINFNLGTRAISSNYVYDVASNVNQAKIIDLSWRTSRQVNGRSITNSENIQTARIVIRKQAIMQ